MTLDREETVAALPQYEIDSELGRGSWGVVLGGRHRQLGRQVAIKQLPRAFGADPEVRQRFVTEAKLLASLDHPHIVPLFDYVEHASLCLLVMERLDGGTVWARFTSSGISPDEACAIVMAASSGLESAHHRGILHRDIKPENLMFSSGGAVKLTDFGIAKVVGGSQTLATRAGDVLGTPAYMAPEQAQNKELGPPTDVYALGTMLYELLAGTLPFDAELDALQLLYSHAYEPPRPLGEVAPSVPEPLVAVTMRSIATDPSDRYATAEEFGVAVALAATEAWGLGWLSRTQTPMLAAGAIVAATERFTAGAPSRPGPQGPAMRTEMARSAPAGPTEVGVAPATQARIAAPSGIPAPPTEAPSLSTVIPMPPARPTITARPRTVPAEEIAAGELVPIHEVLTRPAPPLTLVVLALVLVVASAMIAFIGIGSSTHGGSIPPGALSLGGSDPTVAHSVKLNLANPVTLTGQYRHGAAAVSRVRLQLSGAGVDLASSTAPVTASNSGRFSMSFDLTNERYLVPRQTTGRLTVEFSDGASATERFEVVTPQSSFLTVPGGVAVAAALFVIAYAESTLRSLRRGRKRYVGRVAMAITGAVFGATVTVLAWVAAAREPTAATMVLGAVLGAVGGVVASFAAWQYGERRRWRPRPAPRPQEVH